MTIDYTEKRNFIRMPINYALTYTLTHSQSDEPGICKNLSSDGIAFFTNKKLDLGSLIDVNITAKKSIVAPLNASVEIVRVVEKSGDYNCETRYEIAGKIKKMN